MKSIRNAVSLLFLGLFATSAQQTQSPPMPSELQYFRFILINLANPEHSAEANRLFENGLVKQLGLNDQEKALIHLAGQSLISTMASLRQSAAQVTAGKTTLSPSDSAQLAALDGQLDQAILQLSTQILSRLRPLTADRLRFPGRHVAASVRTVQGGN